MLQTRYDTKHELILRPALFLVHSGSISSDVNKSQSSYDPSPVASVLLWYRSWTLHFTNSLRVKRNMALQPNKWTGCVFLAQQDQQSGDSFFKEWSRWTISSCFYTAEGSSSWKISCKRNSSSFRVSGNRYFKSNAASCCCYMLSDFIRLPLRRSLCLSQQVVMKDLLSFDNYFLSLLQIRKTDYN